MDIDQQRRRNPAEAEAPAGAGPVRAAPDAAPIGDAITAFYERDDLAFGIPAHRAGKGGAAPDGVEWVGAGAFAADIGMNNGIDNRHQSWKVQDMVRPYPPGIPIIAPGERLTPTIVDYLEAVVAAGGMVEGTADESLAQLRVVVR
jgi:arginine/lysine/ornithine decarboxylase